MRELLVTKENHPKLERIKHGDWNFDTTLDAMTDLNILLDEELGERYDWGGKYASWLNSLGLENETENGWWSLIAIDPDNIQAFIDQEKDDDWFDKCQEARKKISELNQHGCFKTKYTKARDIVNALSAPQQGNR